MGTVRVQVAAWPQDVARGPARRSGLQLWGAWARGLGAPGREPARVPRLFLEGSKSHFGGTFKN